MRASGHSLLASYFRVVCDKKQVRSFETSLNSVVPFTYKSRNFSSLQPLGVSWLSFRDPNRLFSMVCSLFCQNRGGGYTAIRSHVGASSKMAFTFAFYSL